MYPAGSRVSSPPRPRVFLGGESFSATSCRARSISRGSSPPVSRGQKSRADIGASIEAHRPSFCISLREYTGYTGDIVNRRRPTSRQARSSKSAKSTPTLLHTLVPSEFLAGVFLFFSFLFFFFFSFVSSSVDFARSRLLRQFGGSRESRRRRAAAFDEVAWQRL